MLALYQQLGGIVSMVEVADGRYNVLTGEAVGYSHAIPQPEHLRQMSLKVTDPVQNEHRFVLYLGVPVMLEEG